MSKLNNNLNIILGILFIVCFNKNKNKNKNIEIGQAPRHNRLGYHA
jgi:hypothetical protein